MPVFSFCAVQPTGLNLFNDLLAERALFPQRSRVPAGDPATEFGQRCRQLGITSVTLHTCRYAWAERAKTVGYRLCLIDSRHNVMRCSGVLSAYLARHRHQSCPPSLHPPTRLPVCRVRPLHGRGVFASGRNWALGAQSGIETALCQRITGTDWKEVLANRWNRKRITKKAHAGRGLETIWEIPVEIFNQYKVMKLYYLDKQNNTAGPVTPEEIQELINQGELDGNPMVVEEGGSEWKTFSAFAAKTSFRQAASSSRTTDRTGDHGARGGFSPTFLGDLVAGPLGMAKSRLNEDFINSSLAFFKKAGHYAIIGGGGLGFIQCIISAVKTNQLIPALIGIVFVVALAILQFTAIAFLDSGDSLIANTPDRVSSKSYLECFGLFALLIGIGFLAGGLFVGIKLGGMNGFVTITIPCVIIFIMSLYNAAIAFNQQTVNVRIEKSSAGEEAVGLLGFLQKSGLKLAPALFFWLAVLGDLLIISSFLSSHSHPANTAPNPDMPMDLSQYGGGMPNNPLFGASQMLAGYGGILLVLLACLVPLLIYILFLLNNLIREVIQAILSVQTKSK